MQGYVMSVRAVRSGSFVGEFGPTRFLVVPAGLTPAPSQGISASPWYKAVRTDAVWKNAARPDRRDILIVVHGYKMSETEIMQRHRSLRDDLLLLADSDSVGPCRTAAVPRGWAARGRLDLEQAPLLPGGASWSAVNSMGDHHGISYKYGSSRAMEQGQDRRAEGPVQAEGHLGAPCSSTNGAPSARTCPLQPRHR